MPGTTQTVDYTQVTAMFSALILIWKSISLYEFRIKSGMESKRNGSHIKEIIGVLEQTSEALGSLRKTFEAHANETRSAHSSMAASVGEVRSDTRLILDRLENHAR